MKTARRFYITSRDIEPDMADCVYTVSGTRAIASFPAVVRARIIVDDLDSRRAAMKIEGTPLEMFNLALAIISVAVDADVGSGSIPLRRDLIDNFVGAAKLAQLKVKP